VQWRDALKDLGDCESYFGSTEDEGGSQGTRYAKLSEVAHTAFHVTLYDWGRWGKPGKPFKECAADTIFFDPIVFTINPKTTVLR
jgi:hypothetical protein